ncbi:MAG: hypothetical protein JWM89_3120 [Acidimicrobiales bacterium]|nr:hypothetical protein [Acidimicrobiales bacterium]
MGSIVVPDPPCGSVRCARAMRDLATAAEHRDVIGIAKGLIMSRSRSTPDAAFEVLRSASMRENVKVIQIAERLVLAASGAEASPNR